MSGRFLPKVKERDPDPLARGTDPRIGSVPQCHGSGTRTVYTLPLSLTLCRSSPQGQYYPLLACPCLTGVQCTCVPNKMPVRKFFRQKWFEVGGPERGVLQLSIARLLFTKTFSSFVYMKFLWKILHWKRVR
jgi:hypothetical protein